MVKITNPRALYDAGIPLYYDAEGKKRITSLWAATEIYTAYCKLADQPATFSFGARDSDGRNGFISTNKGMQ